MKKNLIINGHPNKESFNYSLSEAYKNGALQSGSTISQINIADLKFNVNLQFGYSQRMDLEPDLLMAADRIRQADHLVWIHPVWWGGFPAIMKGFIDRLFLPGITYQPIESSVRHNKLLTGKTAHIIITLDQPGWYYWLAFGKPSVNQLKKCILGYCGVSPVRVTSIGIVKNSKPSWREDWLHKVYLLGLRQR